MYHSIFEREIFGLYACLRDGKALFMELAVVFLRGTFLAENKIICNLSVARCYSQDMFSLGIVTC